MIRTYLALAFLACAAPQAVAATADDPDLARFIGDRTRLADLTRTVLAALPRLSPGCAQPRFGANTTLKVLSPLDFDEDGKIQKGLFVERVPVDLCGKPLTVNVLAIAMPNARIRRVTLLPGDSLADPQLQRDASQMALTVASATDANCHSVGIANTRVTAQPGDTGWVETWDVAVCGQTVPVDVRFTKTASGTDFAATLHQERKTP